MLCAKRKVEPSVRGPGPQVLKERVGKFGGHAVAELLGVPLNSMYELDRLSIVTLLRHAASSFPASRYWRIARRTSADNVRS